MKLCARPNPNPNPILLGYETMCKVVFYAMVLEAVLKLCTGQINVGGGAKARICDAVCVSEYGGVWCPDMEQPHMFKLADQRCI